MPLYFTSEGFLNNFVVYLLYYEVNRRRTDSQIDRNPFDSSTFFKINLLLYSL